MYNIGFVCDVANKKSSVKNNYLFYVDKNEIINVFTPMTCVVVRFVRRWFEVLVTNIGKE